MGVSFKVSKTGKRFQVQPKPLSVADYEDESGGAAIAAASKNDTSFRKQGDIVEYKGAAEISGSDVSFTLSLYPHGYSLSKSVESESAPQAPAIVPKSLLPYDRASETLFSAIESGVLPADILDDIPGRYVNGTLFCEVRDYRNCFLEGHNVISGGSAPVINRVSLKMSLENVVKDIPAISDDSWTYGDMMEVESRIVKALQPQLCLDPTPQLHRLSQSLVPSALKFDIRSMRRKRWSQIPEIAVLSNNIHGKKLCLERVPESPKLGESGLLSQQLSIENSNSQSNVPGNILLSRSNSIVSDGSIIPSSLMPHQSKFQIGVGSPRIIRDQQSASLLGASVASPGEQDLMSPLSDTGGSFIHDKRDNQGGQSSPLANKKPRLVHTGSDGSLHNLGPQTGSSHISELQWKNALIQQQSIGKGIQYANNGMHKYSQQTFEGGSNQEGGSMPFSISQQGIRHNLKEEPVETERLEKPEIGRMPVGDSELNIIDPQQQRLQHRMSHQFMRPGFPQAAWNNLGQTFNNNTRKEDSLHKRKLVQSPRVSASGLPQSPLSSKSGEISSGSIGPQFGAPASSGLVQTKKEKSVATSVSSGAVGIGGNPSFNSTANDPMTRQNLGQAAAKRRSNSLPMTPMGVGSPASISNMNMPINASSPPVGTQTLVDPSILERFSKIEAVSSRYQLNFTKSKVGEYPIRKTNSYSCQQLASVFSNLSSNEDLNDETCKMPLSKSLVGGNMNVCKARVLNFMLTERIIQGNSLQLVPKARTRLIMSEKPSDGSVAFHIGDIEVADCLAAEDYLPTLPNTHKADLLATQFCSLMAREGYHMEDLVQPRPVRPSPASVSGGPDISSPGATSAMHPFSEGGSLQAPNDIGNSGSSGNAPVGGSSQNAQVMRMLPPGHPSSIQISQGLLPGGSVPGQPQQHEQLTPAQQQQLQHAQFQRSAMMLPGNSMQHLGQNANMQMNSHMAAKPSPLQLQMLQHHSQQPQMLPSQQQQQQMMQRKMMSGLGNNMVGLGGLGGLMGMGAGRGVGGPAGISAPMGAMAGMGNMNPNLLSSSISNAIRAGTITQAQAIMKLKMAQSRAAVMGNPQPSIGGIAGARQMHPGSPAGLSMLGPALNRAQIQRAAMAGQMGPPKLMPGMNVYMNQQQQQQLQQHQHQLQQQMQMPQQQQQIQQQQPQEASLPMQGGVSSPQVSSPSGIGAPQQQKLQQPPQQQASPQQLSQRTPMSPQVSSGAVHPMVASNPEACPGSPQLSSQTLGSVGSISNSPMELQGVNKSTL